MKTDTKLIAAIMSAIDAYIQIEKGQLAPLITKSGSSSKGK